MTQLGDHMLRVALRRPEGWAAVAYFIDARGSGCAGGPEIILWGGAKESPQEDRGDTHMD